MLSFKIFSKVLFALLILKMQCKCKKIYLDKEDLNVRLTGHVFWASDKMEDLPTCARRCIEYKKCKSINFSIKYKICELNLVKKSPENQCNLKRNASFINMDIEIWPKVGTDPCFDRPCTEEERCIKNGGSYLCSKIASPKSPSAGPTTLSTEATITPGGAASICPITSSPVASTSLTPNGATTSIGLTTSSTLAPTTTTCSSVIPSITQVSGIKDIKYEGCYKQIWGPQDPALSGDKTNSNCMTVNMCANFCYKDGHVYFGLEGKYKCRCGFTFNNIGTSDECNESCPGNPAEICGGVGTDPCFDRPCTEDERCIKNGGSYLCSKIVSTAAPESPAAGPTTTSTEAPITSCPITSTSAAATITPPAPGPTTTTTTTNTPTTSSSGVAPTPLAPGATITCQANSVRDVRYEGCYIHRVGFGEPLLSGSDVSSDQMTINMCGNFCCDNGYSYFGLMGSRHCECDIQYNNIGSSNDCNAPCDGDQSETCGGQSVMSLYYIFPD